MEKEVMACFSETNTSFMERMYFRMLALFPDVFPDACLVLRFGILPPASQRARNNTSSGLGLGILPPVKDLKKNKSLETKTRIYSIYSPYSPIFAHIRPYRPHIGPYYIYTYIFIYYIYTYIYIYIYLHTCTCSSNLYRHICIYIYMPVVYC